jgi:hypothetical protein
LVTLPVDRGIVDGRPVLTYSRMGRLIFMVQSRRAQSLACGVLAICSTLIAFLRSTKGNPAGGLAAPYASS